MRQPNQSNNLIFIALAMLLNRSFADYCFTSNATSQQMTLQCQPDTLAQELVVNMTDLGIVRRIGDDISDRDCPTSSLNSQSFGSGYIAGSICDLFYNEENTEPDSEVVNFLAKHVPTKGETVEDEFAIMGIVLGGLLLISAITQTGRYLVQKCKERSSGIFSSADDAELGSLNAPDSPAPS